MEEALRARLVASAGVTALVPASGIVWGRRIGLPAIVLHRITGRPDQTMTGPSGLVDSVVQIDCWASTYSAAMGMGRAVKAALAGTRTETLRSAFVENERADFEMGDGTAGSSAPANYHRTSLDVRVWHHEP